MQKNKLLREASILRREFCKDFKIFREVYFKAFHLFADSKFITELCQRLSEITVIRGTKNAIVGPRGCAKSLTITLEYVLYCICYKYESMILVFSSTVSQVNRFMDAIKDVLTTNELLIQDFPDVCELGGKLTSQRWKSNEIITRNGVNVLVYSINQQVRGIRHNGHRPSLIILDDIEADEFTKNPDNFYKLRDKITKSIIPAGTKDTTVILVGTIHHYNTILSEIINGNEFPGWHKMKYSSIISWAKNAELWEEWVGIYSKLSDYKGMDGPQGALTFFKDNEKQMLEGAEVLWPESKSYYDLMVQREEVGYVSFDAEMLNEPVNPRDCHFRSEENHYWPDEFKSEKELYRIRGKHLLTFGSCDPSMGKENKNSDFSAIITLAYDTETETIYILDADVAKRKPDQIIDDIIEKHKHRQYTEFAFESVQFQEYMANVLSREAAKVGQRLNVTEVKHTSSKYQRIQSLQPMIKNGTIMFSQKHTILLEQLRFWPKGPHDDALDALEMAVAIAKKPGKIEVYLPRFRGRNCYNDISFFL